MSDDITPEEQLALEAWQARVRATHGAAASENGAWSEFHAGYTAGAASARNVQTRHADLELAALALLDRLDKGKVTIGSKAEQGTRDHLRSLIPMRAGGSA